MQDFVAELGFVSLGTRLRRLGERLQADVQAMLDARKITVPAAQMTLLACLAAKGPQGVSVLAQMLGVSQPAVTRMVNALVKDGVVTSGVTEGDQRGRTVALTRSGHKIISGVMEELAPAIASALEAIAADARGNLLEQVAHFEKRLADQSLADRVLKKGRTRHD